MMDQHQACRMHLLLAVRHITNAILVFDASNIPGRDYENLLDIGYRALQQASAELNKGACFQGHVPGPFPVIPDDEDDAA